MKSRGVTQSDLAAHFDMTPGGMQKWLSGAREPSVQELLRMAAYLRMSPAELLLGATPDDDLSDLPEHAREPLRRLSRGARSGALDAEWFKRLHSALDALATPASARGRALDYRSTALGLATAMDAKEHSDIYATFLLRVDDVIRQHSDTAPAPSPLPAPTLDS